MVDDERRLNQLDGEDRFKGVNRARFNEVIKTMVSGLDGQVGERVPRDSPGANLNPKRSKKMPVWGLQNEISSAFSLHIPSHFRAF